VARKMEVQVGITVLVALGILLWGVTWLKEVQLARKVRVWHVAFSQAGGLGKSDEVLVNGIRKGGVESIDLSGDHVVVNLALSSEITLTTESRVSVRNVGLMGEKVIAVDLRPSGAKYTERDTIPGVFESGMGEVMAGMGSSVEAMDRVVRSLDALAQRLDRNGDVDHTLANLRKASEDMAGAMHENRAQLKEIVANLGAASKTAKSLTTDREEQYKRTLDAVEHATHNMEQLTGKLDSLRAVAQSAVNKVDHGTGSAAKLLNDPKLFDEASATLKALRELLEDLKANPKKYINVRVL
jgi:phospholipid/cholesterol/gamma-HCH transport system substrate-binding protein